MNNIFTTTDFYGRSMYEIVQSAPQRFAARFLQYVPNEPLTPERATQADASEAEYRAMCEHFGGTPDEDPMPWGEFTNEGAARRAVELHDAMSFDCVDIDAFGAGGMGLEKMACDPLQAELDMLEFNFGVHAAPNPYTERGVEDRTRPVGELLGLPSFADDYDVLAALGERPAEASALVYGTSFPSARRLQNKLQKQKDKEWLALHDVQRT